LAKTFQQQILKILLILSREIDGSHSEAYFTGGK